MLIIYELQLGRMMEDIAKILRQRYCIETPIQSIEKIVNKMGGKIEINTELTECKLGGMQGEFIISVPSESYMKSAYGRFMIVRKLGLYAKYCMFGEKEISNSFTDEVWASEFAMRFLVPAESLIRLLQGKWADLNTSELAAYFNIPVIFYINRVALWNTQNR